MVYFPLEYAIIYYVILNGLGAALMLWDRHLARIRSQKWINQLILLLVAFLGAAPAMMVIMYATHHKLRYPQFNLTLPVMTTLHAMVLFCVAWFGPTYSYRFEIPMTYVYVYLAAVSFIGLILTFVDKQYAKRKQRRVPEDVLMFWAGIGGAAVMLVAMLSIRHKTKHLKFMLGLPIMILVQAGIFAWAWFFSKLIWFIY